MCVLYVSPIRPLTSSKIMTFISLKSKISSMEVNASLTPITPTPGLYHFIWSLRNHTVSKFIWRKHAFLSCPVFYVINDHKGYKGHVWQILPSKFLTERSHQNESEKKLTCYLLFSSSFLPSFVRPLDRIVPFPKTVTVITSRLIQHC